LEERDGPDAPMVAVVNEAFVKVFFPGENPIGKQVSVWYGKPAIVGVVADFKLNSLDRSALPEMFWSLRQDPWGDVWVMARTNVDPALVSTAIPKSIQNFDPDLPLRDMNSMAEVISESLWLKRIAAVLIGLVAALAIVLAGTGIFSIVSYSVSQRTKEVGIRVALGATQPEVLRLILGETWRLALVGCMVGCVAAFVVGRLVTSQSYIAPSVASSLVPEKMNPLAFVLSSMFLCGLALAASLVPARRALRVDPMQALRHE
jgi:putative ABC transport system permease protein